MMVFIGATPIGSPIVGWVAEQFGARWSVGIGSIATLLVAAGAAVWARRAWSVEVRSHLRSRPHVEVRHGPDDQERVAREAARLALASARASDDASAA
jgi:hypothetical protein